MQGIVGCISVALSVSCPRTTVPALTFGPWVLSGRACRDVMLPGCQDGQTVDPQRLLRVEAARMKLHETKIDPAT